MGFLYTLNVAWTAPTNSRYKKNLLNDKRFYRLLSEQTNFIDPDTALLWYTGLVALIGEELRRNKIVRLPNLGDLALVLQKPRVAWTGRIHAVIDSREVIRFYPKKHLKRYFSERQGPPRYLEVLPPQAIK